MNLKKTTQKHIQIQNIGLILKYVIESENITRINLSRITSLAKSTVSGLTNILIKNNAIFEYKKLETKIGKKPIVLKFNKNFCYQIALNISIENIYVAVANIFGEKLINIRIKNNPRQNREQILNNIFLAINKAVKKSNIDYSKIYLISAGTHGVVNPESNIVTDAPFLNEWNGINIKKILEEKYNKKVLIDKDSNLGAIGEHWLNYSDIKNLIYIDMGHGVGSGIIIDNKIVIGKKGQMGEIGYIPVLKNNSEIKNSYNIEFFEKLVNINGTRRKISEQLSKDNNIKKNNLLLKEKIISFKDVCKYYNKKSPNIVKDIINRNIVDTISIGFASLISIIDTDIILLSGEVTKLGDNFIENIRKKTYGISPFNPKIEISRLGSNAPLEGAIKKGIDYLKNELYSNFLSFLQ